VLVMHAELARGDWLVSEESGDDQNGHRHHKADLPGGCDYLRGLVDVLDGFEGFGHGAH